MKKPPLAKTLGRMLSKPLGLMLMQLQAMKLAPPKVDVNGAVGVIAGAAAAVAAVAMDVARAALRHRAKAGLRANANHVPLLQPLPVTSRAQLRQLQSSKCCRSR